MPARFTAGLTGAPAPWSLPGASATRIKELRALQPSIQLPPLELLHQPSKCRASLPLSFLRTDSSAVLLAACSSTAFDAVTVLEGVVLLEGSGKEGCWPSKGLDARCAAEQCSRLSGLLWDFGPGLGEGAFALCSVRVCSWEHSRRASGLQGHFQCGAGCCSGCPRWARASGGSAGH